MINGTLTQQTKLVHISPAANYASTAATAEFINMKLYDKVRFIIDTGAWAGGTAAVTLLQATSDGGSTKAVAFTTYYTGTGDTLTKTTATNNTFNLAAANTKYVIEVNANMLDVANNYDWVCLAIASPGANNDYYAAIAECYGGRYLAGASTPTSLT